MREPFVDKKRSHRILQTKKQFDHLEALFKDIISSVTELKDYFSSDEYFGLRNQAVLVFARVQPLCRVFFGIIQGPADGMQLGHPGIERNLCFTARFLKQPSTANFPEGHHVILDKILEETFFLGLFYHLLLHIFPTRGNVEQVDVNSLGGMWGVKALKADRIMRIYSREANALPLRVLESYFSSNVENPLTKQFKIGIWKWARCHSYFRNLFFSGALLGIQWDLLTKSAPA